MAAAGLVALAIPASAGAATQIGETPDPSNSSCGANFTRIQSGSPGNRYAAPSVGVITSWSYQGANNPPQLKLKVARAAGPNTFTFIGESAIASPAPNVLSTFPARISVQAGDLIGFYQATNGQCAGSGAGYTDSVKSGDFATGLTVAAFMPLPNQLDISASLEPDCDNDGFGDETQDPELPGTPACDPNAPQATITKSPKARTRKRKATFEFTGADARAVAGFECSLDGGAFFPCTSPHSVKVKKGKHTFAVRAIDQAGNVGTPATDTWKRKRKKR